jgi:hypothetical protein
MSFSISPLTVSLYMLSSIDTQENEKKTNRTKFGKQIAWIA